MGGDTRQTPSGSSLARDQTITLRGYSLVELCEQAFSKKRGVGVVVGWGGIQNDSNEMHWLDLQPIRASSETQAARPHSCWALIGPTNSSEREK